MRDRVLVVVFVFVLVYYKGDILEDWVVAVVDMDIGVLVLMVVVCMVVQLMVVVALNMEVVGHCWDCLPFGKLPQLDSN